MIDSIFLRKIVSWIRNYYLFLQSETIKIEYMNTNVLVSPSSISAKYWSELKDLSDNVKLELITLLSSSMTRPEEEKKEPRKGWASRFAGKWKDSRSAEEIMEEIRTARTNNTFDAEL